MPHPNTTSSERATESSRPIPMAPEGTVVR